MEARAEALYAETNRLDIDTVASILQAEAALRKGGGLFGGLFGISAEKYEDAGEKFSRAGKGFLAAKRWDEAAKSYQKSGECYVKAKSDGDAASAYVECARALVKAGNGKGATDVLESQALPRILDSGRLSQAAKLHNEIAEAFENEDQYAEAIEHFNKASEMFVAENSQSSAQKCRVRAAKLYAKLPTPDLDEAAHIFEEVGTECLSNNLLKFQSKSHFFDGLLCIFAKGDVVAAEMSLNKFKDLDYTFPGSRECKLCEDIVQAYKDTNVDAFTDAVYNFDQISKLDPWRTSLLLKVKQALGGSVGGSGDKVDVM